MPGVEKLARFWVNNMEERGEVLRIYPLLGIASSFLNDEGPSLLRCGGGWINYAIQTDGFIIPCPTMWGMKRYYLGHISRADPSRLSRVALTEPPCTECSILEVCGGRCLYANVTKRWSDKAYREVCWTVRELVNAVENQLPRIEGIIDGGKISKSNFDYLKYNGCEIIP